MKLTGNQVEVIANISDGAEVLITEVYEGRDRIHGVIDVCRSEDGLLIRVSEDGTSTVRRERREASKRS